MEREQLSLREKFKAAGRATGLEQGVGGYLAELHADSIDLDSARETIDSFADPAKRRSAWIEYAAVARQDQEQSLESSDWQLYRQSQRAIVHGLNEATKIDAPSELSNDELMKLGEMFTAEFQTNVRQSIVRDRAGPDPVPEHGRER